MYMCVCVCVCVYIYIYIYIYRRWLAYNKVTSKPLCIRFIKMLLNECFYFTISYRNNKDLLCTKCKEDDPSVENDTSVLTLDQVIKSLSIYLSIYLSLDKICDGYRGMFTFRSVKGLILIVEASWLMFGKLS